MGKRRKKGRLRSSGSVAIHRLQIGLCDACEWATHAPKRTSDTPSALPAAKRASAATSSNPSRFLLMLLVPLVHLLVVVALLAGSSSLVVDEASNNASSSPVILRSEQAQLFTGLLHQDVISFLGIRYASAPVRRLRFMPPTPFNYAPNQVHDARHSGPICMQRLPVDFNGEQRALLAELLVSRQQTSAAAGNANSSSTNKSQAARLRSVQLELMERLLAPSRSSGAVLKQLLELEQSEDCLNLNIHTPIEATKPDGSGQPEVERRRADLANLRPVLVLVHGDSFDYGAGATISGARRFAAHNKLLVLTFSYRLNLLGFPPKVAASSAAGNARTNLGLLDQVALLHWLQANIRSFGGSPRNVTLVGAGRGALFVNLLMLSPLAKGLFQRAVIEDGTALSPTLAHSFPQQQQVSWQHLRLLAALADCPRGQGASQTAFKNSSAEDPRKLFECLKASPVETLVQPVPFGLLEPDPSPQGELVLARRWHRPLELLLRNLLELEPSLVAPEARRSLNELANRILSSEESSTSSSQQQQLVMLTAGQLNRLVAHLVATRQLISDQQQQAGSGAESPVQRVSELLDELLGAIYLLSNETLNAHPFAPQLEPGTLVGQEDELELMSSLLQPQSPFGRHDLLVGASRPLIDRFGELHKSNVNGNGAQLLPEREERFKKRAFAESFHPNGRFGARIMRQTGLTDEQAIQQVGFFVRTHFRFHQQEIANSIVSNYFLSDQLVATSARGYRTNSSTNRSHDPSELSRRKQFQLLNSLTGAYEDALVNVPLAKTALVHSLKQLEALAELFLAQQIYRLSELVKRARAQVPQLLAEEQRKLNSRIELEFLQFAQQLYNQTEIWPLDEVWTSNQASSMQQPHSTFFYQLEDVGALFAKVKSVIRKLEEKSLDESERTMASIKRNLEDNLLKRLLEGKANFEEASLACSLFESGDSDESNLISRLQSSICDRIGQQVIATFAKSGNVNRRARLEEAASKDFAFRLEQYEMECLHKDADHHSVQPGDLPLESSSPLNSVNSTVMLVEQMPTGAPSCQRKLDDLSLEYLMQELNGGSLTSTQEQRSRSWPVFNLFTQQLASIESLNEPVWSPESLASDSWGQARDRFDRAIAFWANFLPTLNCSRTQPLGANALAQAQNSTLLNMNLNFNCHQGPRTASSLLQSIQARMKASLADWIGGQLAKQQQQHRWTSGAVQTLSTQNHHSLRMATGNESQLDELSVEAERQLNRSADGWTAPTDSGSSELAFDRRLASLFSPSGPLLSVWLFCGAVLLGSTLLAGGFVLARRRRRQDPAKTAERKHSLPAGEDLLKLTRAHSGELLAASNGPYMAPPDKQQVGQFANFNDQDDGFPQRPSSGFIECPNEQQQQEIGEQTPETILLPIISNPRYFTASHHSQTIETQHLPSCNSLGDSNETNTSQLTPQLQQQQQLAQVISSSSETTTITNRPQSSVSLVSGSTNQTNNDTNGASRQLASSKKRVKISDPKRLLNGNYLLSFQQAGSQMYLNDGLNQQAAAGVNTANFCPVHRASSSNYLVQAPALEYEAASTAFLTNESSAEQTRYLEMLDASQSANHDSTSAVASVGSITDYLNLLAPQQQQQQQSQMVELASNSMRYDSQGRSLNKRRQARQNASGLCRMHSGQTMG